MKSLILFLIVMLLPSEFAMANGNKIVSTENYSVDILNNLDVTTFNNSLRPRSPNPGDTVRTFGFNYPVDNKNNLYSLTNESKSRTYSIKLINYDKINKIYAVCFFDIASPPATYRAKVKLFLKKVDGRYISVSDELIKEQC
ncbi:TPA: hypothetical protein N3069_005061 [Klebsiella pneumoniae]|nr:hypothetical protein [Klebsiella pneumoniae]